MHTRRFPPDLGAEWAMDERLTGCKTRRMGPRAAATAPLFGRDAETRRVREVVDAARKGGSRTLLVTGPAGVGKTSLVRRALDATDGGARLVLWGAGLPMASLASPFRTVRGMLRDLPEGIPPAPVGLGGSAGSVGVDPVEFDAWLDVIARERPVVIVADDLQWVDQESLDVLRYVVAGTRKRAVAVVLTLRGEEVGVGHPMHRWLGHVRRLPGFEELDLAPLDRYATGELVTAVLGRRPHESLVDEVFRRSDGVPYLTRLLVTGLDPEARTLPAEAPAGLEDAVLASWHGLSVGARELATVLAIAGGALDRSDVAALVDGRTDPHAVPEWLTEAVEQTVLDVDEHGRYWFHHPLQAELLEANAHPEDRRAWHQRIAFHLRSALERGDDPVDAARGVALADHYAAAGMDAEAYTWSLRVADGVEGPASLPDVVRALRRALELREAAGATHLSVEDLLVRLREATARAGDLWGELDAVERLLALTDREERPEVFAELFLRRIQLRVWCRLQDLQLSEAEEAVDLAARRPDSWQYALALAFLAENLDYTRMIPTTQQAEAHQRGTAASKEAVVVGERVGSHLALAWAHGAAAQHALRDGDLERARAQAQLARADARLSQDFDACWYSAAIQNKAVGLDHTWENRDVWLRGREDMIAMGAPHSWVAKLSQLVASASLTIGDTALARAMLRDALGSDPGPFAEVGIRLVAARLSTLTGRSDEAAQHWARVEELAPRSSPYVNETIHAEILLAEGRPRQALEVCLLVLREGADERTMAEWLVPLAARALADLGADQDEIGQLEGEFPPSTSDGRVPSPIPADGVPDEPRYRALRQAFEDWYLAELARGRRSADAPGRWEQAATALDAVGLAWEAAYAWMRWGESLLRADHVDRRAAARALRGATERAAPPEAVPVLDQVQSLARAARIDLSTPKEATTRHRPSTLTPREGEILGHLEAGRTYAEIAEALVLSEKTVSSHVSNMLRKTGASNRHDLVARMRDVSELSP